MPTTVYFVSGQRDGAYHEFAHLVATAMQAECEVVVVETGGSGENRDQLLARKAHLALLQESMVGNEDLAVIAPAFDEVVHVVVRQQQVKTWQELSGADVIVGPRGSGMASTARLLLEGMNVKTHHEPFVQLASQPQVEAAIVTIRRDSLALKQLLSHEDFALLSIPQDVIDRVIVDPKYHAVSLANSSPTLVRKDAADGSTNSQGVETDGRHILSTVATPAFLVCRRDAPTPLVRATLNHLYPALAPFQMKRGCGPALGLHAVAFGSEAVLSRVIRSINQQMNLKHE